MLFTTVDSNGVVGTSLDSSRRSYSRTRAEAAQFSRGRAIIAVAVSYDATRSIVCSLRHGWSAPALVDRAGCITILARIPAALVKVVEAPSIRIHAGSSLPRPLLADLIGHRGH